MFQEQVASWEDGEFGAASVNTKRPYGSSDVYDDIAEIIGIEKIGDEYSDDEYDRMSQLHSEMETILQIVIDNLHIREGLYTKPRFGGQWKFQQEEKEVITYEHC